MRRSIALVSLALALCLGHVTADGQGRSWSAPRTPWGHPDLQGTYSNDDETGTPMERPRELEGKTLGDITPAELQKIVKERNDRFVEGVSGEEFAGGLRPPAHLIFDTFDRKNKRAWLVIDPPDGRIPRRTDARVTRPRGGVSTNANPRGPFNSWLDMGLYDRCITRGIPASMMPAGYGSRYDITQSPDSVVIRYEMIHEARVIPLDSSRTESREARSRATPGTRKYLGDPRGWWEGDTLVVETTNFRPETAPQGGSDQVMMTERFIPVSQTEVDWRVTFEDPNVWTRPWTYEMPLTKVDRSQQMFEYACHEGNLAMRNILSAARKADGATK
ncbi:MAG TPA: hypothetical protein VGF24_36360 [Vicinamibacterales bacterium]|jgi:hypothetical protein